MSQQKRKSSLSAPVTSISLVIPVYNEEENLPILHDKITAVLARIPVEAEVIYVDDGSKDTSLTALHKIAEKDSRAKIISFMRNYGQTSALAAGIDQATGEVIIFMDADLQNDPADIPLLLDKLSEGYDVVSGWRADRKDTFITRTLPSKFANRLISSATGVFLHDYGCTLKAYRREYLQGFRLYGEMHRFLPAYAAQNGARMTEVAVSHHPRIHGVSKYGLERILKVILDLMTVKFLSNFGQKPIYLFGSVGLGLFAFGILLVIYLLIMKIAVGASLIESPLLLLAAISAILSVQSIFLGLIAELLVRTYHESQDKMTYRIRETVNFRKNA